jgi:serine phosphatase RsbU (regulator of sigma subunit)
MRIRTRISLVTVFILLLSSVITVTVVIWTIKANAGAEIERYRTEEMGKVKQHLKDLVDLAYETVDTNYLNARLEAAGNSADHIRKMRYDGGTGYFWINDSTRPHPNMIIHPVMPGLEGRVMDDPLYDNIASDGTRNLFQAILDVSDRDGEGYVDYVWPKPLKEGISEPVPKLSYVRLYKPLDWIIGTGVYIDSIDQEVARKTEALNRQIRDLIARILAIALLISLVSVALAVVSANSLTRPLRNLISTMMEITRKRDLSSVNISLSGAPEIREMGAIFNNMLAAVNDAARKLAETTAAKERIESELKIAADIQMSILPKIFPPFPDKADAFDLHAVIEPAKEVGGDFYDFFYIDEARLCFAIGDVSGKGVPASLFMAVTKTLIKTSATAASDPGSILTRVNKDLSEGNDACMFVTVFLGILNTRTGEILFANGGHNPPLILDRDGSADFLDVPKDPVVGAMEDYVFKTARVTLKPGQSIFTYTDGVTEAMNEKEELFSGERLHGSVSLLAGETTRDVIRKIMKEVKGFAGDAPQSDDITMLMVRYKGGT